MRLVRADAWLMDILRTAGDVVPSEWAVTSGTIRNLVWDHLHGHEAATPVKDVDVAFFDRVDVSRERDKALEEALRARLPEVPWEVTNQAGVHLWYAGRFGHEIPPIVSLEDGISRNPEIATSIGIRLEADEAVTVIAPCGLVDLFEMILRHNPKQVPRDYFLQRLREKRIREQWPKVSVIDLDRPARQLPG
ncbi:MAG: uncharacterized protein QOK47_1044 [Actinomycetota bacterium]|nr:uncharacterized protein [Actinomycetota bacterium]